MFEAWNVAKGRKVKGGRILSQGTVAHLVGSRHVDGFPFAVHNNFQALPHPTSVKAGVVAFNLNPILTLCLSDGSLEGIAGFLISFRVRVSLLESVSSTRNLSADVACNPWLMVGKCTRTLWGRHHRFTYWWSQWLMWCTPQCHRKNPGTYFSLC